MSLDAVTDSLKQSLDLFKNNAVALVVGTIISILIIMFLGWLIIPLAPIMYGLTYMAVKAARGEKVEIVDVFFAFRSVKRFIRSWMYFIVIFVLAFIVGIIAGILFAALGMVNEYLAYLAFVVAFILIFIIAIGLLYSNSLFVLNSSMGVIDCLKESLAVSKGNILGTIVAVIVVSILQFIGGLFIVLPLITTPIGCLFVVCLIKELRPDIPDTADDV